LRTTDGIVKTTLLDFKSPLHVLNTPWLQSSTEAVMFTLACDGTLGMLSVVTDPNDAPVWSSTLGHAALSTGVTTALTFPAGSGYVPEYLGSKV